MSQQSFNAKDWFNARVALRDDFLRQRGLANAPLSPVGEDSSSRRYFV